LDLRHGLEGVGGVIGPGPFTGGAPGAYTEPVGAVLLNLMISGGRVMNERRKFLKVLAAGPAGALLVPLFSETGANTLAQEVERASQRRGRFMQNIIFMERNEGVWKGKAGSHVPSVSGKKVGDKVKLTVETSHGMSEEHYIVRHTVVSSKGEVLGAKTFSWKDKPISEYEVALPEGENGNTVFVTSFCNQHDLWLARTKVEL